MKQNEKEKMWAVEADRLAVEAEKRRVIVDKNGFE